MSDYLKKIKRLIILISCAVILGTLCTVVYAGANYYKAGKNTGKIKIDEKNITEQMEQGRKKITINIPRQYIEKLSFCYNNAETFSNAEVYFDKLNVYGKKEEVHVTDKYMVGLPRSVVNINGYVSNIKIDYDAQENPVELTEFIIDNTFKPNPLLAIFLICIFFITGFLIFFKEENSKHPGIVTFVCILVSSTCILLIIPPYVNGWDEQIHYLNTYEMGVSKKGEHVSQAEEYLYNNAALINKTSSISEESIEERLDVMRALNSRMELEGSIVDDYSIKMTSVGYIFQALALKVGNSLKLPFYINWYMGKFANVLLYSILLGMAVSIAPIGKRLLMVISMLPIMIFQSANYTYDITVISFIILALSIIIREYVYKKEKFRYRWRILFFVCLFIGCSPKAVYCPLILSGLLLGKEKFYSDKDRKIFKGAVISGLLILLSSFVLPVIFSPQEVADTRGGDTSEARQIEYVLKQPFAYAYVLARNVLNSLAEYIMGNALLCNWAYLGVGKFTYCYSALLAGVTLTDSYIDDGVEKRTMSLREKVFWFIQIAMVIVLIWTALYLNFTEVGKTVIAGVQARYYLPFIFVLYLCFQTNKIYVTYKKEMYQMVVTLLSCGLLFQQMWTLIVTTKCL